MAEVPALNDQKSVEIRQRVLDHLDKLQRSSGSQINVSDLEKTIFENAKDMKEYGTQIQALVNNIQDMGKQRSDKLANHNQHRLVQAQQSGIAVGSQNGSSTLHSGGGQPLLQQHMLQQPQQPDPINALQHLTKQGMHTVAGQQTGQQVLRQPSVLQQRLQFQTYPGGPRPQQGQQVRGEMMLMQQPQQTHLQMMTQGQIMPSGQFVSGNMPHQFHLSVQRGQHVAQMHPNVQSFNQLAGSPGNVQGSLVGQQSQQHLKQQMQPSPAGLNGPAMMIPSPSNLNIASQSPAMQQHLIGLSPSRMSLSSPGSHLNTPGNPGSIGPAVVGNIQMSASEEQEYLQKWEQLQKYIEPLKKMISRIDKDEDRKMDMNKMKNLLDILSDRTKRLSLNILLKCESVLERQLQGSSTSTTATTPGGESMAYGQALYDSIAASINSPYLYHCLKNTFGSDIVYDPSDKYEIPVTKSTKSVSESEEKFEVNDLIQGEVAKLHKQFIVNIDNSHFLGSEVVSLTCRLDDENLPPVPSLVVRLPKDYPTASPIVYLNEDLYDSSALFRKIKESMMNQLNRLNSGYSLTSLLNLWEICVKKSYSESDE